MFVATNRASAADWASRRAVVVGMAAALVGLPLRARAAARPLRVICLEWTSAEMVLSLGVAPIAICDTRGYQDWVAGPAFPADTIDLGSRSEPNIELLMELRPDLICGAYGYGLDESTFKRFARTFTVPFYTGTTPPFLHARQETLRLGNTLGLASEAQDLVEHVDAVLEEAKTKLARQAQGPLCVVSMFDDRHVRVYGAGSLIQDVLDQLGIENVWQGRTNSWGFSTVGIEELVAIGDARLISLDPIPPHIKIRIDQSSLWANLPCVRNGRVTTIPPVWPFGGLAAAARFAEFLASA
jgi:ABC-type Fe3+-hydroxamate transport system substrate-binding protein